MNKDIEEFLNKIECLTMYNDETLKELENEATVLLKANFKQKVIDKFHYSLTGSWSARENIKAIKEGILVKIIDKYSYESEIFDFLEEHFDRIREIVEILKIYIDELEAEKGENEDE